MPAINLDFFNRRLPARRETVLVLSFTLFVVFAWAIKVFIYKIPSYVLYYGVWDILSILAYLLAFALFESLLVVAILLGLAVLLPGKWLRDGFGYKGFLSVLVLAVGVIYLKETLPSQPTAIYFAASFGFLLVLWIGLLLAAHLRTGMPRFLLNLADRFSVFFYLCFPLGLISLCIIIFRLIW